MKLLLFPSFLALLLRASPASMIIALLLGLWGVLKRDERSLSVRTFIIAALVPIAGVFPDLVTGLLLLTVLSIDLSSHNSRSIAWAAPALILMAVWSLTRALSEFDIAPFVHLFAGHDGPGEGGVFNVLRWLRGGPPGYFVAIEDCIRLVIIVSLSSVLPRERGDTFAKGLLAGGALCSIFALVEWFAPQTFEIARPPHLFWKSLGRMTGFATDPNALGILLGALVPLSFTLRPKWLWAISILLIFGGIYSGSRSFFILPIITACYFVWRTKGTRFALLSVGSILVITILLTLLGSRAIPNLPVGLVRLQESINLTRISETVKSRTIFTRLCLEAFKLSPIFGVGLGRFEDYVVPLSHSLQLGTGVWRDGATSFYLEILCELGLVGVLVFLGVALSLRRATDAEFVYRGLGIAFLAVLIVVPATNFSEGVALAGLLLAQTVVPRWKGSYPLIAAAIAMSALVPFRYAPNALYGFYPWEPHERGFIRWTATESRGVFGCNHEVQLTLINGSPIVQDVEVRVDGVSRLQTLQKNQLLSVSLPCREQQATYFLNVSPGFTPAKYGHSEDERLLGVRQISADPLP
jgi:hypothetical protein